MRGLLLIGLTLFVATSALAQSPTDNERVQAAEAAVASRVRDPTSAHFQDVFVARVEGVVRVCGEVNATNAYGGYTGFQRFVVSGGEIYWSEYLDTNPFLWAVFCGLPMPPAPTPADRSVRPLAGETQ